MVGGGTGLIGDPTDRASERPLLSEEQVERNLAGIRRHFARYLDLDSGRALMVNNADWLRPLNYLDFLRTVGRHFTVNQLMQHGTYWERFQQESFSFIELNYALVQAYDFLHLYRAHHCILQIGGNDQWFNILAGRDLIRRADGGEGFALTVPLIQASGAKMGKTAGNAIWLDAAQTSPYDYYQYWRNTDDADVGRFLRVFTFLPLEEIAELERLTWRRAQSGQGSAGVRGDAPDARRRGGPQGAGHVARAFRRRRRGRWAVVERGAGRRE